MEQLLRAQVLDQSGFHGDFVLIDTECVDETFLHGRPDLLALVEILRQRAADESEGVEVANSTTEVLYRFNSTRKNAAMALPVQMMAKTIQRRADQRGQHECIGMNHQPSDSDHA